MDHSQVAESLFGFGEALVVFCQSAVPAGPGEGAFDDPAPRLHVEGSRRERRLTGRQPVALREVLRQRELASQRPLHPASEPRTPIALVTPDQGYARESSFQAIQQPGGRVTVGDVGR